MRRNTILEFAHKLFSSRMSKMRIGSVPPGFRRAAVYLEGIETKECVTDDVVYSQGVVVVENGRCRTPYPEEDFEKKDWWVVMTAGRSDKGSIIVIGREERK